MVRVDIVGRRFPSLRILILPLESLTIKVDPSSLMPTDLRFPSCILSSGISWRDQSLSSSLLTTPVSYPNIIVPDVLAATEATPFPRECHWGLSLSLIDKIPRKNSFVSPFFGLPMINLSSSTAFRN